MKPPRDLFTIKAFSLWQLLEVALLAPTEVVLDDVWVELESALETGSPLLQLQIAGEAIHQISEVFALRSQSAFDELEAVTAWDGPVMPSDAFAPYVRQTTQIEFDQHLEPIESLDDLIAGLFDEEIPESGEVDLTAGDSIAGEVTKESMLSVLEMLNQLNSPMTEADQMKIIKSLSHGEDVPLWSSKLIAYLQKRDSTKPMTLLDLPQALGMPFAEVWLTLLLGEHDYQLRRTGDDFYSATDIEVVLKG